MPTRFADAGYRDAGVPANVIGHVLAHPDQERIMLVLGGAGRPDGQAQRKEQRNPSPQQPHPDALIRHSIDPHRVTSVQGKSVAAIPITGRQHQSSLGRRLPMLNVYVTRWIARPGKKPLRPPQVGVGVQGAKQQ